MIVIIYYFYIYSFALILLNCFNMNDVLFFIFVNLFDNKIGSLIYHNDNICLLG